MPKALNKYSKNLEGSKWSERHARVVDTDDLSSLEQKKQEGYF